jgi:hypothetical protein
MPQPIAEEYFDTFVSAGFFCNQQTCTDKLSLADTHASLERATDGLSTVKGSQAQETSVPPPSGGDENAR